MKGELILAPYNMIQHDRTRALGCQGYQTTSINLLQLEKKIQWRNFFSQKLLGSMARLCLLTEKTEIDSKTT